MQCISFPYFFNKNIGIFRTLTFEILYETLTNDVVSFEQPGPVSYFEDVALRNGSTFRGKFLLICFPLRIKPYSEGRQERKIVEFLRLKV